MLRATVMAGGSALAAARGRQAGGARLLAATVAGLVVLDPLLVHRAAFRLSVAASAGILLAARALADSIPGPRVFRETAGVTLAAQAAVTPLLLTGFGPVPVAALPANLLAAPVAGPLMVWGITGGLVAGLLGPPWTQWSMLRQAWGCDGWRPSERGWQPIRRDTWERSWDRRWPGRWPWPPGCRVGVDPGRGGECCWASLSSS